MKKPANPLDVQIGHRLREIRMARGWSQEKLGEALGITFQQVQKYEKGTNRLSVSRMLAIGEALGVTAESFLHGVGDTAETAPRPLPHRDDMELWRLTTTMTPQARKGLLNIAHAIAEAAPVPQQVPA